MKEGIRLARERRSKAKSKTVARREPVILPRPESRPVGYPDPETAAGRAGDFTVHRVGGDAVAMGDETGPPMRRFGTNYNTIVNPIPDLKSLPPPGMEFDLIGTASAAEGGRIPVE
jgi:hypothetical protein